MQVCAAVLAPACALAQQRPIRIGFLSPRPLAESNYAPTVVKRLAELGYREGREAMLEYRSADGRVSRYPGLAAELLADKCDLIFAIDTAPAKALREARSAVPVAFLAIERDPVTAGVVTQLRRPDGNATGVYIPQEAMVGKRIQILREMLPVRRVLVLSDPISQHLLPAAQKAAAATGIGLTIIELTKLPYDYAGAFEMGRKENVEAVMLVESPRFSTDRAHIAALLNKHRRRASASPCSMPKPVFS
jgi:putative ABC transport system substrate-binding protein